MGGYQRLGDSSVAPSAALKATLTEKCPSIYGFLYTSRQAGLSIMPRTMGNATAGFRSRPVRPSRGAVLPRSTIPCTDASAALKTARGMQAE